MSRVPIRYLPWMLRDALLSQGVVLAVLAALTWLLMRKISPPPSPSDGPGMVAGALQQMGWPFILYCAAAIVSSDRTHGYYRSIFSRPVSPPLYYLERWLVGALIAAAMVPMLTLGLSLAIGSFPVSGSLVARTELLYLLLGGLVFLFSTVIRVDWLLALMFLLLQKMLHELHGSVNIHLSDFWNFVYRILPPFHLTAVNAPPLTGPQLTHVLLYGAGLVLAALAVLRWRPLGAGGRA